MNNSILKIYQVGEYVEIMAGNKKYKLNIKVWTDKSKFVTLMGPRKGKMISLVNETLKGIVEIELVDVRENKVVFSDITDCAGVEFGGEQMLVLD
jgi:hypothetical protein